MEQPIQARLFDSDTHAYLVIILHLVGQYPLITVVSQLFKYEVQKKHFQVNLILLN